RAGGPAGAGAGAGAAAGPAGGVSASGAGSVAGTNHDGNRPGAGPVGRGSAGRVVANMRRRALVTAFPVALAALNRAGLRPLRAELSGPELRRAGLRAMGEVAARLDLGAAYVVFGHTHRPGPLPGDDAVEWRGRGGARLVNAGSWTYSSVFLRASAADSPYWP